MPQATLQREGTIRNLGTHLLLTLCAPVSGNRTQLLHELAIDYHILLCPDLI